MLNSKAAAALAAMHRLTVITVAVALWISAPASARDYEVEVIVFDRIAREAGRAQQERWNFSSPRIAARLEEMQALAARASSHPRTATLGSLQLLRERLEARDYRILATARWRQPATFYPNAPVIRLGRDGEVGDGDVGDGALSRHPRSPLSGGGDGDGDGDDAVAVDGGDGVPSRHPRSPLSGGGDGDVGDGDVNPLAAGFVRVYRTSLIYADVNLQLSPPMPESGEAAAAWQAHYFIAEKRRLKFKQIHYFDHPLFGAILRVWPVETDDDAGDGDGEVVGDAVDAAPE